MTTLVTGAGLIGTAFARHALKRGEKIVFFDPEPRESFLRFKLGDAGYDFVRKDVRDLPALDYEIEPGEPPHSKTFPLDISGAKAHLGWEPKFSLREGFEDFFGELKSARAQGFI